MNNETVLYANCISESCVICCEKKCLVNCSQNFSQDGKTCNFTDLLFSCFHIRLLDERDKAQVCVSCMSYLKDAAIFRDQIEIVAKKSQLWHKGQSVASKEVSDVIKCEEFDEIKDEYNTPPDYGPLHTETESDNYSHTPIKSDKENIKKKCKKKVVRSKRHNLGSNRKINTVKRKESLNGYAKPNLEECVVPKLSPSSRTCPLCKEEFEEFDSLQSHFSTHFYKYLCDICGQRFKVKITYYTHLNTHGDRFPCPQCGSTFNRKSNMTQHIKAVHKKIKLFCCPKCKERFCNNRMRQDHIRDVHSIWIDPHICPICQKKCYSAIKLDSHNRIVHLKEKNFACPNCNLRFSRQNYLHKHMLVHSDIRKYICDICQKAFKTKKIPQVAPEYTQQYQEL